MKIKKFRDSNLSLFPRGNQTKVCALNFLKNLSAQSNRLESGVVRPKGGTNTTSKLANKACRGSSCWLSRDGLERKSQRQLQLPRIANSLSQEAVEVEQRRCAQRINVVLIIESIEHLNNRN